MLKYTLALFILTASKSETKNKKMNAQHFMFIKLPLLTFQLMKVPLKQEWMHANPIQDKMNLKWEENRRSDEIRIFHLKAIREKEFTEMEALETHTFVSGNHSCSIIKKHAWCCWSTRSNDCFETLPLNLFEVILTFRSNITFSKASKTGLSNCESAE